MSDDLASKAIDTIEFSTLWAPSGRQVVNLGRLPGVTSVPRTGAVLSCGLIRARLCSDGPDRIVVTPLLDGALEDAGIDLRLSPVFIVGRHSATSVFDGLDSAQDPRMMQEVVEKGWGDPFILHPDELVLASTLEYVVLPVVCCSASRYEVFLRTIGRDSPLPRSRFIPGSRGCITLELVNHGETPIALTPGSRVAELILFQVGGDDLTAHPGEIQVSNRPQESEVAGG